MTRYVVVHDEAGVFLGECMGLGFWSKLDAVGQEAACALADRADAEALVERLKSHEWPLRIVPVECAGEFATIAECVAAGLPGWTP